MKHALFRFAGTVKTLPLCAALMCGGISVSAFAQQPVTMNTPGSPAMPAQAAGQPAAQAAANPMAQPATSAPNAMTSPGMAQPGAAVQPATTAATTPVKSTAPEETNPFSNVKPVDNQALKQALPALEQRVQQMESQMSAIQQVQVAMPADALGGPSHSHTAGGAKAPIDDAEMELQSSTFVACVNGQALFRDTDQKPFFVDAKEANQNEAIRRIGGCKH